MLICATIFLFAALYFDYVDEDVSDEDMPDEDMPDEDVPDEDVSGDEDMPDRDAVPAADRLAQSSPRDEAAHVESRSPSLSPSQSCTLPSKPARFGRRSPPPGGRRSPRLRACHSDLRLRQRLNRMEE